MASDLKKELDKYLKVLKRSSKIQSWNDRDLIPGPGMGCGNNGCIEQGEYYSAADKY